MKLFTALLVVFLLTWSPLSAQEIAKVAPAEAPKAAEPAYFWKDTAGGEHCTPLSEVPAAQLPTQPKKHPYWSLAGKLVKATVLVILLFK